MSLDQHTDEELSKILQYGSYGHQSGRRPIEVDPDSIIGQVRD